MAKVSFKVVISGMVQGVSFRSSMREVALRHDVQGWVRNREDGAVEALLQGEEEHVRTLLEWARVGPPGAKVASVQKHQVEGYPPQDGFRILVEGWRRPTVNR